MGNGSLTLGETQVTERRLTFADRDRLISDLERAGAPGSAPTVLAVFNLLGVGEYRRAHGAHAGRALTYRLALRFAQAVDGLGACYQSRRDEFCVLIADPTEDVTATLIELERELQSEGATPIVAVTFGAASLPDEAAEPIAALKLADERLRLRAGGRKPPRKQQASASLL